MDNGSPWGSDQFHELTPLTAWLIRLGIGVSHSRPYHPQTQGKDERFHRTLNVEAIIGQELLDWDRWHATLGVVPTISALANMKGVNPQLQAHFNIGFNVGLTEAQMRSLISVLEAKVGKKEAENANEILSKVVGSRAE